MVVSEKQMYANTLSTLLCLDHVMTKDLMNLEIETLAKMYVNYIQNAKEANHAVERVEERLKDKLRITSVVSGRIPSAHK